MRPAIVMSSIGGRQRKMIDKIDRYHTKLLFRREIDFGDWLFEILSRRKWVNGHISFHVPLLGNSVTLYGANAMWFMVEIHTMRYGYICFRPPLFVERFPWKFYCSPNATPQASTFFIGGKDWEMQRELSQTRRLAFGHNFNTEEVRQELHSINGYVPSDD